MSFKKKPPIKRHKYSRTPNGKIIEKRYSPATLISAYLLKYRLSVYAFSHLIKKHRKYIRSWLNGGAIIAGHAFDVEVFTRGEITAEELCAAPYGTRCPQYATKRWKHQQTEIQFEIARLTPEQEQNLLEEAVPLPDALEKERDKPASEHST